MTRLLPGTSGRTFAPLDVQVANAGAVAIVRALPGLGDFLCAVPALRALRMARPDVEIVYVGLPETAPLVRRFSRYVDRLLPIPGFPGLPERRADVRRLPGFLAAAQSFEFDLAIQLHGSGELTNPLTALLGARRMAGYYRRGQPSFDAGRFLPWVEDVSEVRRNLRLMAHLGWPADDESLEFPVAPTADAELASTAEFASLKAGVFVCLHPGAAERSRRWSPAAFAEVGDQLGADGLDVVLTGTEDERELTATVRGLMHAPAIDAAGATSLDGLAALYRRAALVVCNDTGVSHLAAALRTPSVVIFRTTDPRRWAPLDRQRHRVANGSVREVVTQARRLMRGAGRAAGTGHHPDRPSKGGRLRAKERLVGSDAA